MIYDACNFVFAIHIQRVARGMLTRKANKGGVSLDTLFPGSGQTNAATTCIPTSLQDLLDAGLSRHLVDVAMQSQDQNTFLSVAEALLVRERVSRENAMPLWDAAAMRFFNAPAGAVQSRSAFVAIVNAQIAVLPDWWQSVLCARILDPFSTRDIVVLLGRYTNGERYFYIFDEMAEIAALLWAASLDADTQAGRSTRTALRMQLANVHAAFTNVNLALQTLNVSLSLSVFADDFDAFLNGFIAKLGHVSKPDYGAPSFEDAMHAAQSKDVWKAFVEDGVGGVVSRELSLRFGDW